MLLVLSGMFVFFSLQRVLFRADCINTLVDLLVKLLWDSHMGSQQE